MKLYRSRRDKKITGLCGGLAEWLDVDSTLLRVLLVITAVFSGGTVIFLYFVISLIVPKEPWDSFAMGHVDDFYPGYRRPGPFSGPHSPGAPYGSSYDRGPWSNPSSLDEKLRDVERKAMQKEIDRLKEKLARYENNEKGDL